jgi:hypothetical protein
LCSKAVAVRFSIRHSKKKSVHQWSTQPSTIQHPTPARRYG